MVVRTALLPCGAVDYLVNVAKKQFNVFAGTSTGALITPLVATGNTDVLVHTYQSVQTTDILTSRPAINALTLQDALNSAEPLYNLINDTITDEIARDVLTNHRVYIATVNLASGDTVVFHTQEHPPPYSHITNGEHRSLVYLPITNQKALVDGRGSSSIRPFNLLHALPNRTRTGNAARPRPYSAPSEGSHRAHTP